MISMKKTWEEAVTVRSSQWVKVAMLEPWQNWQKWMVWGYILVIELAGLIVGLGFRIRKCKE